MRFSGGHPASSQVFLRVRAAEALRFFSKNRVKLSFDTLLYNGPKVSPAFSKAADSKGRAFGRASQSVELFLERETIR
jgi:hypothetical protein